MEKAPVFIRIHNYKEILDIVDVMKQKLKETHHSLEKVRALKSEEDQELREWEKNVSEISKRLSMIDSAFFENE